jgi:hypothetical protein
MAAKAPLPLPNEMLPCAPHEMPEPAQKRLVDAVKRIAHGTAYQRLLGDLGVEHARPGPGGYSPPADKVADYARERGLMPDYEAWSVKEQGEFREWLSAARERTHAIRRDDAAQDWKDLCGQVKRYGMDSRRWALREPVELQQGSDLLRDCMEELKKAVDEVSELKRELRGMIAAG